MDKDYIYEVGLFVSKGHTIEETSMYFDKSISSIKKYLQAIRREDSPYYNPNLAERIKLAQEKIELMGRKKGGSIGKRTRIYTLEQRIILANAFLNSGMTFEQFAEFIMIPRSTLHELIRSIDDHELQVKIDRYILKHKIILADKFNKESVRL